MITRFFSIPDWTNSLVLKSISHIFDDYMSIFNLLYNKKKKWLTTKCSKMFFLNQMSHNVNIDFVLWSVCAFVDLEHCRLWRIYICHINRTHMPINDTIMLGIILLNHLLQQYSYDNKQNTKYPAYTLPIIISFA